MPDNDDYNCGTRTRTGGDLDDISTALPFLEALYLENSGISGDLSALSSCINLAELVLDECVHGDLSSLSPLLALKSFHITPTLYDDGDDVFISGDLSSLSLLQDLVYLRISGCPRVNGNLSSLASLVALKDLEIKIGRLEGNISLLSPLIALRDLHLWPCSLDINGSPESFEPLNLMDVGGGYCTTR